MMLPILLTGDITMITKDLIGNVGFPIAAFLLMYKQTRDMRQSYTDQIQSILKTHGEETEKMRNVLEKNTMVLESLKTLIENKV